MKFLVKLKLKPDCRNKALEAFELRGPNRNPGVTLERAWVNTSSHIVFVLAESTEQALVEKAGQSWSEFGECEIHPVVDIEQY